MQAKQRRTLAGVGLGAVVAGILAWLAVESLRSGKPGDLKTGGKPASSAATAHANETTALGAAQRDALEKMATAVKEVEAGLHELDESRPRTPEWMHVRLMWHRKLAEVRMILAANDSEREAAADKYIARATEMYRALTERQGIVVTRAMLAMGRYQLAEAAFFAAGGYARKGMLTAEQQSSAEPMAAMAAEVVEGLKTVHDVRPPSPEWLETQLGWERKALDVELILNSDGEFRKAAIEKYTVNIGEFVQSIRESRFADSALLSPAIADYAEAEVGLIVLGPEAAAKETEDYRSGADKLVKAALEARMDLKVLQAIRPKTPEFVDLDLHWAQKLLAARLAQNPDGQGRKNAMQAYMAEVKAIQEIVRERKGVDATKASIAMMDYAVAEAEYWAAGGAIPWP